MDSVGIAGSHIVITIKQDHPVPIGYGETISAPHMHAEALRLLEDHCSPGASVLDVGSGEEDFQWGLLPSSAKAK